jgi:hypothetical protein
MQKSSRNGNNRYEEIEQRKFFSRKYNTQKEEKEKKR